MSIQERISRSGLTIYDSIPEEQRDLFIPAEQLERILEDALIGNDYGNLPLRTRSKVANQDLCRALGYPVPSSFKKTKPRFPGQNFDKYVQKANNLQVWNDELDPTRRYVVIRQDDNGRVSRVRVITGADLGLLDTTGTLTQKYQARLDPNPSVSTELISPTDTGILLPFFETSRVCESSLDNPVALPSASQLLPIQSIFEALRGLVGCKLVDAGSDQERNRGAELHRLVCERLGYTSYADNGRFPDVRNQLLEVKLQTSRTIDLGLVLPTSTDPLDGGIVDGVTIRHCDIRYALFHGVTDGRHVTINHFYLTTGVDFFRRFQQFAGKVLNKKLQIPLPSDFFDGYAERFSNSLI
jgi:hypothetical protein